MVRRCQAGLVITPAGAGAAAPWWAIERGTKRRERGALWAVVAAVWVCSPPPLHPEHVAAAARAGRHVFVERPIANSLEAADQIIAACRSGGVRLMVGHVLRWVPALQRLRQLAA